MKEITVSAKTLNDAITEASIELGVSSDQMEYDVIEKGSPGFLGIGSKQAVIRARRKVEEEEISFDDIRLSTVIDKKEKRDRKEKKEKREHREPKGQKEQKISAGEESREEKKESKENKENRDNRENKENKENKEFKEKKEKREESPETGKEGNKEGGKEGGGRNRNRNRRRDRRKKEYREDYAAKSAGNEQKKQVAGAENAAESDPQEAPRKEIETAVVTEETKAICEVFLRDVLKAMGMENVEMKSRIDEDGSLAVELSGDEMGILIGKRGQTLDSLQYLTNRVANKSQEGYVRVKLDTEDYRKRRQKTLENLAKNIAYKVKRSRKPIALEPMNPYERRIIHSALQSDSRVSTHSEGEEPYRRVVVTLNRK